MLHFNRWELHSQRLRWRSSITVSQPDPLTGLDQPLATRRRTWMDRQTLIAREELHQVAVGLDLHALADPAPMDAVPNAIPGNEAIATDRALLAQKRCELLGSWQWRQRGSLHGQPIQRSLSTAKHSATESRMLRRSAQSDCYLGGLIAQELLTD
jgi:hypothetical protein